MEREFLSQKGSGGGRGVKKKSLNSNSLNTSLCIGVSTESENTMNEDTLVGAASTVKEGVTPFVVDMTVEMEKLSSLEDTTSLGCFSPLSTPVTTTAGNAPDKSLYANVTGKPSGKKLNIRTLFTPGANEIDVVVLVESIRAISERFANTSYYFFLGKRVAYPIVANYVRNTWGSMDGLDSMLENGLWFIQNNPLILKKWHLDKNLLKEDVSFVPVWVKLHGVPVTAFSKDGLSVIVIKLADVELKDNIVMAMPKITEEGHYICNVCVEYEWKPPSGNKKKGVEPTIQVSNSNPFEVINSVDNDEDLGTNRGTTNLVNNGATSSGSSFMNVDNSSTGTAPIIDKIRKFKELLTSRQAILVDEAGNPLKKVEFLGDYESEDEVASVDNDMVRSMAFERVGFGTQSLLEQ
ncbi:zinc finger, CCHC-type containing protein [Tanacetum coccineum]